MIINPTYTLHKPIDNQFRLRHELDRVNPNKNELIRPQHEQKPSIKVLPVAQENLLLTRISRNKVSDDSYQISLKQKPTEQYKANQELIEREQMNDLLGIDLFA